MVGMMYNDAGMTGAPIDDVKQSQAAVLRSMVGTALDLACRRGHSLGAQLHLSASRVARVFKAEMGMSLVQYRNRLRLERFSSLLDERGSNLLEAALAAGFGSCAQFHRVFLAERAVTPGKFLRARGARQR